MTKVTSYDDYAYKPEMASDVTGLVAVLSSTV